MSLKKGGNAENVALNFLKSKGLSLKAHNFRCKLGEIDLIMTDGNYLVFIEVRMRSSEVFGGALESVTVIKQKKIKRTLYTYNIKTNWIFIITVIL